MIPSNQGQRPGILTAIDVAYEREQKRIKKNQPSKKQIKEQETIKKKLEQFSKDDYDTIHWLIGIGKQWLEEKRGLTEQEKDTFTRLEYQTNMAGTQPETSRIYFDELKQLRNNRNLEPQDIIDEVETYIRLEKG